MMAPASNLHQSPGVSPLVLTDFLLDHSVFMRLLDISDTLPAFDENVVEVDMLPDQKDFYLTFEEELREAVHMALAKNDHSLLGALVNSLLAYPDGARRGEIVLHPHHVAQDGEPVLVASAPPVNEYTKRGSKLEL